MLLNGLGFHERTLYQTSQHLETLPVARLFGSKEICADDNALGPGLDKIARYGTSKLFNEVAFKILNREGLLSPTLHDFHYCILSTVCFVVPASRSMSIL